MGIDTKKLKLKLLVISSLIVGFSVAFTGMIGFVGIIIPHIVRLLVKNSNRKVIPLAMLLGGLFLLISDTIARIIIEPTGNSNWSYYCFFRSTFLPIFSFQKEESMKILTINNLNFNYGNKEVLKDINLQFQEKKVIGIMGMNGCGKSTLLKNIINFLHPVTGEIIFKTDSLEKNIINFILMKELKYLDLFHKNSTCRWIFC